MPSTLGVVASGEDVLNDAVLWLDASRSVAGENTMVNYGKGGSALNAQYGSTGGTDTNDPLLLTHTGTNYLYLPGLAGNSVSCTAPGTATSFAATPVAGGGDTTGAATGGAAFTFSTAGSWSSVRLLNAGGSTVAQFTITAGNQTGQTDGFGVVWTLNRASSGRKSVAVVRPVLLFGTDDYREVADNDLLDFGAGESATFLAVVRHWNVATTNTAILDKRDGGTTGWDLQFRTGSTTRALVNSGGTSANSSTAITSGPLLTLTGIVNRTAQTVAALNGTTSGSASSTTSVGTLSNALPLRIGRLSGAGSQYSDMELVAVAVFRRVLPTNETATVVARYA